MTPNQLKIYSELIRKRREDARMTDLMVAYEIWNAHAASGVTLKTALFDYQLIEAGVLEPTKAQAQVFENVFGLAVPSVLW